MADYYEILGVSKTATDKELKVSYRKLAMEFHPDRNPGNPEAEARFKEISVAYEILKDSQKRAAYDQYGEAAFNGSMGGGGAGMGGFDFSSSFSDLFEEMFGEFGGRRSSTRLRGADLRYNLTISLEEAYSGREENISVSSLQSCQTCDGSGADEHSEVISCPTCEGHGKVRAQQGFFTIQRACHHCQGAGRIVENPCADCNGAGRTQEEKNLDVDIPAGVEDGTRIRVAGEGEAGMQGGPAGDLYIFVNVDPHSLFARQGPDLFCRVPIPMTLAALGGEVDVPLIDGGKASVKIPEGTQSGSQFRMRGKGMTEIRSSHCGDMYVEAIVEVPQNLTKKQKELLKEFSGQCKGKSHPDHASFTDRVKAFWEDLTD